MTETVPRSESYPNEQAIRDRFWDLSESGQVKVLQRLAEDRTTLVSDVIDDKQAELRTFLREHPAPSAAMDNMHVANLGRDIAIGVEFRIEWLEAVKLLSKNSRLIAQPGWADYTTSNLERHPKGSGRDRFDGAMHNVALLAHDNLCTRGGLPDKLVFELFDRMADHQDALKRLTESERNLMGASVVIRPRDFREPREREGAAQSRLMRLTVQEGFSEQIENARVLLEALLQPLASKHAQSASSWAQVQRAVAANWGPMALPIGTTREALFEMFGRPRALADGVELEVAEGRSGLRTRWDAGTQTRLVSERGLCPAYPALRGAPPLESGERNLMTDGGVAVRDSISTGRLLVFAGAEFVPLLGTEFPELSHLDGTPTLASVSAGGPAIQAPGISAG